MHSALSNEKLFQLLDALYIPTLKNVSVQHPRLMVWFSGPPSSGKSRVARAIEEKFQALRLENDAIRILLLEHFPQLSFDERNDATYAYSRHLSDRLLDIALNGFWVIDSSIDRRFADFYAFADTHRFDHLLIAMDIPEEIHREWIVAGGDRPYSTAADYLKRAPQRRQEQQAFLTTHTPDIILGPDYAMKTVLDAVAAKLDGMAR